MQHFQRKGSLSQEKCYEKEDYISSTVITQQVVRKVGRNAQRLSNQFKVHKTNKC